MSILNNKIREFKIEDIVNEYKLSPELICKLNVLKENKFTVFKSKYYSDRILYSLMTLIYEAKEYSYIFRNLNSLFSQNMEEIEIIILTNGISKNLLQKLSDFIADRQNIILVSAEISQYDKYIIQLNNPIAAFWNLGLILSKGKLFSHVSWDDEINSVFCSEIYKVWQETNVKCISPVINLIDKDSNIDKEKTSGVLKNFSKLNKITSAKEVMISKMNFDKSLFTVPGELLASERHHILERGGFDFLWDITQFFKLAAGEDIALSKKSILKWRYHDDQAHLIEIANNATYNKISKYIYKAEKIFELNKDIYGIYWANKVNNFFLINLQRNMGYRSIIFTLRNSPKDLLKRSFKIFREVGMIVSIMIILKIVLYYASIFFRIFLKVYKKTIILFKTF